MDSEDGLVKKAMTKWIFPKSHIFWKMCPDSKQDYKKNMIYTVCFTSRYEAL